MTKQPKVDSYSILQCLGKQPGPNRFPKGKCLGLAICHKEELSQRIEKCTLPRFYKVTTFKRRDMEHMLSVGVCGIDRYYWR